MMGEQTIHVYDEFGQILEVKGICHFSMESTGKKYIFYHLNEEVQGNRIKMYVAEVGENQGEAAPIPDEVWASIRDYMSKLLKREKAEGITGLPMKDSTIHLGKVKKIGVPKESIAVFAATNVIGADTSDTPVVSEENKKEKEEVKLEKAPAVTTVLEPVKDEEIYKKVEELDAKVEAVKASIPDTTALEAVVNQTNEQLSTTLNASIVELKTTITSLQAELDTVKEELANHIAECNSGARVLTAQTETTPEVVEITSQTPPVEVNMGETIMPISEEVQAVSTEEISESNLEETTNNADAEAASEYAPLEPEESPEAVDKPAAENINQEPGGIVDPTRVQNNPSEIGATVIPPSEGNEGVIRESILVPPSEPERRRKEPEDTLYEPNLTNPQAPKITPVSIVDPAPLQESVPAEDQEPADTNTLYEPELVTKEPQYFENAARLSETEANENPLDPQDDSALYNTQLPPENPGVDTAPLVENPLINSINDSTNYVPYDEGATVQTTHFSDDAPVTMPDGNVDPSQIAPLPGTNGSALTPNQLP